MRLLVSKIPDPQATNHNYNKQKNPSWRGDLEPWLFSSNSSTI